MSASAPPGRRLTIVMYHYVRDLARSRFPALKALTLDRFRRQLDHIAAHYTPVRIEDVLAALGSSGATLPGNAILLTFDDGYADHFTQVFPLLDERRMQGCFYPSARTVLEHRLLDVNKIHFVLASTPDAGRLLDRVFAGLDEFRAAFDLASREQYLRELSEAHRFDRTEVIVLKRLLQWALPEAVRTIIVQQLFAEFVTVDEAAFAAELYMSIDQIACLRRHGMHIGSHGYSHAWLNRLPAAAQADEIDRSLEFLRGLGGSMDDWTVCYPYGGYNDSLLDLLRARGCRLGLGVEPRIADLAADERLALPRLDTNDLPS